MSFYVTLEAKQDTFKGVLQTEFNKAFRLRGEWEVGIISCYTPKFESVFWVFSNIVDFTYVNEVPMQLMDVLETGKLKIRKPLYSKVIKKTISSINMEFKHQPTSDNFLISTDIVCILHFRKA